MKKIDIIGVRLDKGASMEGAEFGPKAIRVAGLHDALKQLDCAFNDYPDICQEKKYETGKLNRLNNLNEVNEVNTKLYKKVSESLSNGCFPLILGGDHSLAAGSIMAAQKHYGKIGVIWIDTHGDFNNALSSPSGNIHGMPLSAVTGNGPDDILPFKEKQSYVDPKNCVIIAARAFDTEEKIRIKNAGVTVFSMADIDKEGIYAITKCAVEIASSNTNGIHLSFDLDALDPSLAPGVSTPEIGGLTCREALLLCEYLCDSNKLIAAEIVELNPLNDVKNQTAAVAVKLISSLFSKPRT